MDFVIRSIEVVLGYGLLLVLLWAFVDSTRFSAEQYKDARRMSRTPWLFAVGLAVVLNFSVAHFTFSEPLSAHSLAWLASLLVLLVYVYDMRPKLVQQRLAEA